MGAAKVLVDAGLEVTLFEEAPRLGGHCFAVPVPAGRSTVLVDAGVSDFSRVASDEVRRFMAELGLTVRPVTLDSTCTTLAGDPVWTTRGGIRVVDGISDVERFFAEIELFAATCLEVTAEARFSEWTARRYLDEYDYGPDFRRCFFNPRAGGSFPMPDRDPEDYFIRPLVAYWQVEGLVGPGPAERLVVEQGMHAWPTAFHLWYEQRGGRLRTATRVVGVSRRPRGDPAPARDARRRARVAVVRSRRARGEPARDPLDDRGPDRRRGRRCSARSSGSARGSRSTATPSTCAAIRR